MAVNEKKKKIVQITTASTGGLGRLIGDLYDALPKDIYETVIMFGRGPIINAKQSYKFGNRTEILTHIFMSRITGNAGLYSASGTAQLIEFLQEENPDIIHLHNLHGYYLNYELLFKYIKQFGIPIVWTLHDCWAFTGHCTYFSLAKCTQWKTQCLNCSQLKEYPKCYYCNISKNFYRKRAAFTGVKDMKLITPSNWLKNLLKESFLKEYDVKVIPNGINFQLFRCKDISQDLRKRFHNKKVILGVVALSYKRKGFQDFIRLSTLLPSDYIVVLAGLPENVCKNLPEQMMGIAYSDNAEALADLYNVAELFLNLTYEDNFPTTNLESLACGTSVLTYNTGGSIESITIDTGYIVEQGNVDKAAAIIKAHNKTAESIAACCRQARQFDKMNAFEKYHILYQELLEEVNNRKEAKFR